MLIKVVKTPGRTGLALFQLILFAWFYLSITFFPHSHRIGDIIITHSHYYWGYSVSTQPVHSHSANDLRALNELSLFLTLAALLFNAICTLLKASKFHYTEYVVALVPRLRILALPPRAPPA